MLQIKKALTLIVVLGSCLASMSCVSIVMSDRSDEIPDHEVTRYEIEDLFWSTDPSVSALSELLKDDESFLLAKIKNYDEWDRFKEFTAKVSDTMHLVADGAPSIRLYHGTGGVTHGQLCYAMLRMRPNERALMKPGVKYDLEVLNHSSEREWVVSNVGIVGR